MFPHSKRWLISGFCSFTIVSTEHHEQNEGHIDLLFCVQMSRHDYSHYNSFEAIRDISLQGAKGYVSLLQQPEILLSARCQFPTLLVRSCVRSRSVAIDDQTKHFTVNRSSIASFMAAIEPVYQPFRGFTYSVSFADNFYSWDAVTRSGQPANATSTTSNLAIKASLISLIAIQKLNLSRRREMILHSTTISGKITPRASTLAFTPKSKPNGDPDERRKLPD